MNIQTSTLPNGLRIVTQEMPGVVTAALGMWVDVGTRNEMANVNGISHFLEHMAFKGTTSRSAKEIAEEIENVGGQLNAYTSRENTAYHARVLKEDVPLAVQIIADILQNSTFEEEEIEKEREVILQEMGQAVDTPDDVVFDHFQGTAFPNHPLGRPILGKPEIIKGIGKDDLKKYISQEYSASRMVFSATGGVKHEDIVSLCQKYFSDLPQFETTAFEKAHYQGGQFHEGRKLEQVHLVLGFESCPFTHEDHQAYLILSALLGGGMSSRLFQEVREKRGLVYSIYAFHSAYRDTGIFQIYAGTGESQVKEVIPTLRGILEDFPNTLTEKEVERSKAQFKAALFMSLESTSSRCDHLGQQMLIFNRPLTVQDFITRIDNVTKESLVRVGNKLLTSPATFSSLGPGGEVKWD